MRETCGGAFSATDVVGRDAELAAVAAFLDVVRSGPCGVVLEGEAGIGKTAIWRVGAAWAADRAFTVLSKRLIELQTQLPDDWGEPLVRSLRQPNSPDRAAPRSQRASGGA